MPIVQLVDAKTEGCTVGRSGDYEYGTILTHVGKCLFEREHNMRDDSDFYMTVWNDEKNAPEEIMFATTRGWSYPCMASRVDATDEVKEKYQKYLVQRRRNNKAGDIRAVRKDAVELATKLQITRAQALKLMNACADSTWKLDAIVSLLTGNIRSEIKISFRTQVREWIEEPNNKYKTPLSGRQWPVLHPMRFAQTPRGGYNARIVESMSRPAFRQYMIKMLAEGYRKDS